RRAAPAAPAAQVDPGGAGNHRAEGAGEEPDGTVRHGQRSGGRPAPVRDGPAYTGTAADGGSAPSQVDAPASVRGDGGGCLSACDAERDARQRRLGAGRTKFPETASRGDRSESPGSGKAGAGRGQSLGPRSRLGPPPSRSAASVRSAK